MLSVLTGRSVLQTLDHRFGTLAGCDDVQNCWNDTSRLMVFYNYLPKFLKKRHKTVNQIPGPNTKLSMPCYAEDLHHNFIFNQNVAAKYVHLGYAKEKCTAAQLHQITNYC